MTLVELLRSRNLLDWEAVLVGWRRDLLSRADVESFAADQLRGASEEQTARIIDLLDALSAGTRYDVEDHIQRQTSRDPVTEERAVERWRLARLLQVRDTATSDEALQEQMVDVYASFGYPEGMRDAIPYGSATAAVQTQTGGGRTSARAALDRLIADLERRLLSGQAAEPGHPSTSGHPAKC